MYDAWRAYRSLATDFEGLLPVERATEAADRLAGGDAFEREVRRLHDEVDERIRFRERMVAWLEHVRTTLRPLEVDNGARDLEVGRLLRVRRDPRDPHRARVAEEMLEAVFVHASFYQPRDYDAIGRYDISRRFFLLARRIKPTDGVACVGLARSAARTGREEEALEALECAVASGAVTGRELDSDPAFEGLRTHVRFVRLRNRILE